MTIRTSHNIGTIVNILVYSILLVVNGQNSDEKGYLDRFTYEAEDIARDDSFFDYCPENWDDISCNEGSRLDECEGYIDKWETGRDWTIERNYCRWCPDGEGRCDKHHQSPINLQRAVGYEPGTHPLANECIDIHWMKYEDSFCSMEELVEADAFTIERHALRIAQPITVFEDYGDDNDGVVDGVRLDCRIEGLGSRFGRIDFSKGFSQWWYLSHTDIHVPSEHVQDDRRYDAEIQLKHFYSATANEAGVNNEVAGISIFMNAYDDAPPYRYLDKVICQWRRKEYEVRKECGLDPIPSTYPGCFPLKRRLRRNKAYGENGNEGSTLSVATNSTYRRVKNHPQIRTAEDVILHNHYHRNNPNHKNVKIYMDDVNWSPPEDKDWNAWIATQSKQMDEEEQLYQRMKKMEYNGGIKNYTSDEELHEHFRKLYQGDELEWFNYWPMIGVRTEYYFRYGGSDTIPPCYGNFQDDTRAGTHHWRVLKDPLRIHPRQLAELKRLIGERIAPKGSLVNECQLDTSAKVKRDYTSNVVIDVDTARPLQEWNYVHFKTFCECKDWESKWPEDRHWCTIEDISERFFDKPYNFGWE